jgi:hypothetical protein
MADDYPKALNAVVNGRTVPMVYRPKHVRHAQHVVFADAVEEKAHNKADAVAASTAPEMVRQTRCVSDL